MQTHQGSQLRIMFLGLVGLPLIYAADQNGGLLKFGFSFGSTLESEYKIKPDYATGTLFAAERKEVPTLKNF